MQRRQFLSLLTGGTVGSPVAAPTQQEDPARPRIEIEEMKRQLNELRQQRIELLSVIINMRPPLRGVRGYTKWMLDDIYGDIPNGVRFALENVRHNGIYATGLINGVFDPSKIQQYG
jgi:hypothetical protein